jgi:hypothetical protein
LYDTKKIICNVNTPLGGRANKQMFLAEVEKYSRKMEIKKER